MGLSGLTPEEKSKHIDLDMLAVNFAKFAVRDMCRQDSLCSEKKFLQSKLVISFPAVGYWLVARDLKPRDRRCFKQAVLEVLESWGWCSNNVFSWSDYLWLAKINIKLKSRHFAIKAHPKKSLLHFEDF